MGRCDFTAGLEAFRPEVICRETGDCGNESEEGDGMEGMEPCGELVLELKSLELRSLR